MAVRILFFICLISLFCIGIIWGFNGDQTFDNQTYHSQWEDLMSYRNETSIVLDQYFNNKISFTYTKVQAEHLNEKVYEFYKKIASDKIPSSQFKKVTAMEKVVFALSYNLKQIQSSQNDKKALKQIKNNLTVISKQLKTIDYE
jgi:hypothetical protein